ncbi:hypothetical protein GOODEAATRI_023538 [Goodea atripinnis]|uniref:Uncharacterized protein n=1 Tax=Goodea atripinnis TaxID=208336 RepID=A0ABV0PR37_9TELE
MHLNLKFSLQQGVEKNPYLVSVFYKGSRTICLHLKFLSFLTGISPDRCHCQPLRALGRLPELQCRFPKLLNFAPQCASLLAIFQNFLFQPPLLGPSPHNEVWAIRVKALS